MQTRTGCLLPIMLLVACSGGLDRLLAQDPYYGIDARLDLDGRTVTGEVEIVWSNRDSIATDELWFHLYLNAFRDRNSTFLREGDYESLWSITESTTEKNWGSIDVSSIELESDPATPPLALLGREFSVTESGNPDDKTVMRLRLDRMVEPGEAIRVRLAFTSKLPRGIARTGWAKGYLFAGQWYPKLGVYRQGRWLCSPYYSTTEYFSDFAEYKVDLDIPQGYTVGGTGNSGVLEQDDAWIRYRFRQTRIHDFAFVASPRFVRRGFSFAGIGNHSITVQLLLLEENLHLGDRYLRAAQQALSSFEKWFGRYPYASLTLIDTPAGSDTGGMEYPTLVTLGVDHRLSGETTDLEEVTFHEIAHQWWYAVVASNEVEEAWLDEGLATWSEQRLLRELYPEQPYVTRWLGQFPLRIDGVSSQNRAVETHDLLRQERVLPIRTPSWLLPDREAYGLNSYTLPHRVLMTLERLVGSPEMERLLKTYYQRYTLKHAGGDEFIEVAREVLGDPAAEFLSSALGTGGRVDYGIDSVRNWTTAGGQFQYEIRLSRNGELDLPVEVLLEFEEGSPVPSSWHPRQNEKTTLLRLVEARKLKKVILDPASKLALDWDPTNNTHWAKGRPEAEDRDGTYRWSVAWLFWLQTLMEVLSFVG